MCVHLGGYAHTPADPAGKPCTKVRASKPCYERIKFKIKYVIDKLSMKICENLNLSLNLKENVEFPCPHLVVIF